MACGVLDPSGNVACDLPSAGHDGLHTGLRSMWFGLRDMRIYWGRPNERSAAGYKRPLLGTRAYDGEGWLDGNLALQPLQTHAVSSSGSAVIAENTWTTRLTHTVVGSGRGRISISWAWANDGLQWLSFTREMRVLVNGVEVVHPTWSGSGSWSSNASVDHDLLDGDVIVFQVYTSGTGRSLARTLNSWSFWLLEA